VVYASGRRRALLKAKRTCLVSRSHDYVGEFGNVSKMKFVAT